MSYYTDRVRFVMLIEDKIKEMKPGETLRKEWVHYKGLSLYGYGDKSVDGMMKAMTSTGKVRLTEEGDLILNE